MKRTAQAAPTAAPMIRASLGSLEIASLDGSGLANGGEEEGVSELGEEFDRGGVEGEGMAGVRVPDVGRATIVLDNRANPIDRGSVRKTE
jgi:hypothetical protein